MNLSSLVLFTLFFTSLVVGKKEQNKTFVATDKWQEIREGQEIPAGLHVRINLQTGKKEAKLLDKNEKGGDQSTGAVATVTENASETPPKGTAKYEHKISKTLEETLKKLPKDGQLALEHSPENAEKIKRKYKSYTEIKKTFDAMRTEFKTDMEIIAQLIGEYKSLDRVEQEPSLTPHSKVTEQLRILDNFNYLVHQIDNALCFVDEGGLEQVLLPLIVNQTHVGLRAQAMRVLGALTHNNPKAQIKVFQVNFGSHLSQILISSTNTEELSTALYAFGSLLRKFPHAQQRIFSTYGFQALTAVLSKECELKIKAKAATLISDVVLEKQLVLDAAKNDNDPLAAAQYAELNFPEWLRAHSYCDTMDALVASKLYELLELPDLTEYFVQALETTHSICKSLWSQSPQLHHTLLTLKSRYSQNTQDEYRLEVVQQIVKVVGLLYGNSAVRDEL